MRPPVTTLPEEAPAMNDLYALLGVSRTADQAEIRRTFKKLARELHPDLNKDPAAGERFKAVTAAYEVLGDEQRRALYDEFGEASLRVGFDADQARAFKNAGGFGGARGGGHPFAGFGGAGGGLGGGGGGFSSFEDLFSGIFQQRGGAGGGAGPAAARGPRRGADIEERVHIDFLTAVRGGEVSVRVRRPANCGTCHGEGGTGRKPCTTCSGSGRRPIRQMGVQVMVQCEGCGGAGHVLTDECRACGGTGRTYEEKTLTGKIPAGIETGAQLRLRGRGGAGERGGPAGDVVLTVDVAPHAFLRRSGRDLEMDLPLNLVEALAGGQVEVPTLTGNVKVRIPMGAQNGARLRIPGRGVQTAPPGDLTLVLRPVLPAQPDPALVEAAARAAAEDVRAKVVL
jgi:molecular chaperone DnaJ